MLAYFKDTSAKILRVQISKCTDAIPQATPQASPRKRPLVAGPRGGPLTTAQSAAPAAPKQRQKCTRQRKRYTHTPSRAVDTPTHTVSGCLGLRMYRLGLPNHWAAACRRTVAVPSPRRPPHNKHAPRRRCRPRRSPGARRIDRPRDRKHRAGRRGKSRKMMMSSRGTRSRRGY